jgi:ribose transport system substrate-binding protein
MKKILLAVSVVLLVFNFIACGGDAQQAVGGSADNPLIDGSGEEYYMVTFASGIEYWQGCFKGFEKAAAMHGAKVFYQGAPGTSVNDEVTVFQQIVAKKPAGIAVTCVEPQGFLDAINEAVAQGIHVVTFDADSPASKRYAYLGTGNENAGAAAAAHMVGLIGGSGEVGVVMFPGLLNQEQRSAGFVNYMKTYAPNVNVVQIANGGQDQSSAASATAALIQAHPNIKGLFGTTAWQGTGVATAVEEAGKKGTIKVVSFDTDQSTLDAIRGGTIQASVAQGTQQMGFWAFEMLYLTRKNQVVDGWKERGLAPTPSNVDTGVSIVTAENVDNF